MGGAYSTDHSGKRMCLILAFDYKNHAVEPRPAARREAAMCEASFKRLGFDVLTYMNLEAEEFEPMAEQVLKKMSDGMEAFVLVIIGRVISLRIGGGYEMVAFESSGVHSQEIHDTFQPHAQHSKLTGKLFTFYIRTPRGGYNNSELGGEPSADEDTSISPIIHILRPELDKHKPSEGIARILRSVIREVPLDYAELQKHIDHQKKRRRKLSHFLGKLHIRGIEDRQ